MGALRRVASREGESERLLQFLRWVVPLVLCFAALTSAAYAIFEDSGSGLVSVILACYGLLLVAARFLVERERCGEAVAVICIGLLVAALLVSLAAPGWGMVLVLTPLLAVSLALPYARGRALSRLLVLAWTAMVFMAASSVLLTPSGGLPEWFTRAFTVSAVAAAAAMVLLLLWQFSTRLNDTLGRTRAAEERYALAERGANDGLWDWDFGGGRVYYSPRWKEMIGLSDGMVGSGSEEWFSRVHPEDLKVLRREIEAHIEGDRAQLELEYRIRHEEGGYLWVLCRGLAVRDAAGRAVRMAGSQTDITRRKEAEERLIHNAFHDSLTGLPNRDLFLNRLDVILRRSRRFGEEESFAVLFIDLDNFKSVNDSLGHEMGDRLLVAVAERLRPRLRPGDTLARLGGDEFTVLVEETSGVEEAEQVADRIIEELRSPFVLGGYELFTTASVGIVLGSGDYERPEDFLRDADTAMYRAKSLGRSRKNVFERTMRSKAVALFNLETELRRAMEREEFVIHYQPIVSLASGRVAGFEALIRWQHPERGLIPPEEFVPVAEESGLILPLEFHVLREACHQTSLWQRRRPDHQPLTINVNLSRNQLGRTDLFEKTREILEETSLQARSLRLEITESALMKSTDHAFATLLALRDLDVEVHIDDFGTGYSSLSALHSLPIDSLKIDRTFVSRMDFGDDSEIVQTIVTLSHNLGLDVIAEGIESERQLRTLREMGCDFGQGFLFSRPSDGLEATDLLDRDPRW